MSPIKNRFTAVGDSQIGGGGDGNGGATKTSFAKQEACHRLNFFLIIAKNIGFKIVGLGAVTGKKIGPSVNTKIHQAFDWKFFVEFLELLVVDSGGEV